MKQIILFILLSASLSSCVTGQHGCGTWRDVRRHDSKPFRADIYRNYHRVTLVAIQRTMFGNRHFFVTDTSDTLIRMLDCRLRINQCYLISKPL